MSNNNVNAQVIGAKLTENNVDIKDLVVVENSQAVTTSLKVAEVFGKEHKNVIAAVKALECSKLFHELNFKPMFKNIKIGNGAERQIPYYNITRDGVAMLAFGFTGKRAAHFKEAYINAFNAMEAKLREIQEQSLIDNNSETFSLVEIVDGRAITTSLKVAKVFEKLLSEISSCGQETMCDVNDMLNDVEKAHTLRYNAISKLIMMKSKQEAARLASLYYHGVAEDE